MLLNSKYCIFWDKIPLADSQCKWHRRKGREPMTPWYTGPTTAWCRIAGFHWIRYCFSCHKCEEYMNDKGTSAKAEILRLRLMNSFFPHSSQLLQLQTITTLFWQSVLVRLWPEHVATDSGDNSSIWRCEPCPTQKGGFCSKLWWCPLREDSITGHFLGTCHSCRFVCRDRASSESDFSSPHFVFLLAFETNTYEHGL